VQLLAFSAQVNCPKTLYELPRDEKHRMRFVFRLILLFGWVFYALLSIFGFLYMSGLPSDDILSDFPKGDKLMDWCRVVFAVLIICKAPLLFQPFREIMEGLINKAINHFKLPSTPSGPPASPTSDVYRHTANSSSVYQATHHHRHTIPRPTPSPTFLQRLCPNLFVHRHLHSDEEDETESGHENKESQSWATNIVVIIETFSLGFLVLLGTIIVPQLSHVMEFLGSTGGVATNFIIIAWMLWCSTSSKWAMDSSDYVRPLFLKGAMGRLVAVLLLIFGVIMSIFGIIAFYAPQS